MNTAEFIEVLERQGTSLAHSAAEAGLDAAVPTCPGWRVHDLVVHTGQVHRWAAAFVTERITAPRPLGPAPNLTGTALLTWFDDGLTALAAALRAAPGDLECWTILPGTVAPRDFWVRRQAHETTIHRADAESARGAQPDGIGPGLAVDGIDELLAVLHNRPSSKVRTETPRVLRVRTTDTGDVWTVRLSADPLVTERTPDAADDADCEVSGPAKDLYLALWNRLPFPSVTGDTALVGLWRERSGIG